MSLAELARDPLLEALVLLQTSIEIPEYELFPSDRNGPEKEARDGWFSRRRAPVEPSVIHEYAHDLGEPLRDVKWLGVTNP